MIAQVVGLAAGLCALGMAYAATRRARRGRRASGLAAGALALGIAALALVAVGKAIS